MRRWLLPVMLFALVLIAVPTLTSRSPAVSAAKPTTTTSPPPTNGFTINPQGVYINPVTAQISGQVRCEGGTGTFTFTNPPGTPYTITGTTDVLCDGTLQNWTATITSPSASFTPGAIYLISATLAAPSGTASGIGKVYLV